MSDFKKMDSLTLTEEICMRDGVEGDVSILASMLRAFDESHPESHFSIGYDDDEGEGYIHVYGKRDMTPEEHIEEEKRLAWKDWEETVKAAKEFETKRIADEAHAARLAADEAREATDRLRMIQRRPDDLENHRAVARRAYWIPTNVSGQDEWVHIGDRDHYTANRQGVFVFKNKRGGVGLHKDGTWSKYGDPFDTFEEAYAALLTTNNIYYGENVQ